MKERAVGALEKIKGVLDTLSRKTKILIGGVLVVTLALMIGLVVYNYAQASKYAVLFSDLNTEEASTILAKLDEYGAPYQYKGDGRIMVPVQQEPRLKAKLLQEGYPKSGLTYDVFKDNVSMMTTDFEKRQYTIYELQNRMQATLRYFDGIKDAVVNIVPAEDSSYVLDTSALQPATASIMLTMEEGKTLSNDQVAAIQNLVARGVPGLQAESIAISDQSGNFYAVEDSADAAQDRATKLKLDTERAIESTTRSKVLEILEGFYGKGNVRVSVNSTVELKNSLSQSTTYTSPDGAAAGQGIPNQVAKDQEVIRPTDQANQGGVVGTQANADINTYTNANTGTVGADDTYAADRTQTDYSLNSVKEQNQDHATQLADLSIAVSINATNLGSFNEQDLIRHIARAAGIDQNDETTKISIAVAPFYNPNAPEQSSSSLFERLSNGTVFGIPAWIILGAIGGIVLLLLVILLIVLRRRKKKRKLESEQIIEQSPETQAVLEAELERQKQQEKERDLLSIQNEKSMELKESIRKFSEESPEVAADLLSSWLRGGNPE